MKKAVSMGKVSATGSFQLFIGVALSSAILAVGSILLARLLSPVDYGLYSVALTPALMIELFRDWGVDSAVTKYVAHSRINETTDDIHNVLSAGLLFEISMGLGLSLLSVCISGFVAETFLHRPEIAPLVAIASVTIFSGSLLKISQASFVGFEKMKFQSLTLVCQSIIKSFLAPILVILGFGSLGAVMGHTASFLLSGIIGVAILYLLIFRRLKKSKDNKTKVSENLKSLLHYGIPLSISSLISGFLLQFYNFMMAFYCSDLMIGNYQVALNFAVLLTFFTVPITTVLFPAFAKVDPQNEPQLLKTIFKSSVKYAAVLLVPATTAVMVLSEPMVSVLYGEEYVYAPLFLALYVSIYLLSATGNLSMGTFLTGLGETKTLMKLSLLPLLIGLPLSFVLIPQLGVIGVILGILISGVPRTTLGLYWIWKNYGITTDWWSSAKILIASGIAAVTTFLVLTFLNAADWLNLIIGVTVFLSTYIIIAPSIGAVVQEDLNNLKELFSGLGFISRIVNLLLGMTEKIAGLNLIGKNKK